MTTNRIVRALGAKSGSTVSADIDGTVRTIQVARDLTVAANDALLVVPVGSIWVAVARLYTGALPAPGGGEEEPPPDPQPAIVVGRTTILPTDSGTWFDTDSGDYWSPPTDTSVFTGSSTAIDRTGAVWYGMAPDALEGVTVTAASLRIYRIASAPSWDSTAPSSVEMKLMTESVRPSGAPTLTGSPQSVLLPAVRRSAYVSVATAWAQAIVDGTSGGIGFAPVTTPAKLTGANSADAMALTIDWQREL